MPSTSSSSYSGPANGFAQRYSTIIQTITVAALFVAGFWAGVISPLAARIEKQEWAKISKDQFDEFRTRIDGNIVKIETNFSKASEGFVPRAELVQKWTADAAEMANIKRSIDDLRKDLGGTYSLRDAMIQYQQRLDRLEGRMIGDGKNQVK